MLALINIAGEKKKEMKDSLKYSKPEAEQMSRVCNITI